MKVIVLLRSVFCITLIAGTLISATPKMCLTDFKNPAIRSSDFYRQLAYQALVACNHPCPEEIVLINDERDNTCAGSLNQDHFGINFVESHHKDEKYGSQCIGMFHEAWHLTNNDVFTIDLSHTASLDVERTADQEAALRRNCIECAREAAEFYFNKNRQYDQHLFPDNPYFTQLTLEKADKASVNELQDMLSITTFLSNDNKETTHPYEIERALRLYLIARTKIKPGSYCDYHKPKESDNPATKEAPIKETGTTNKSSQTTDSGRLLVRLQGKVSGLLEAIYIYLASFWV